MLPKNWIKCSHGEPNLLKALKTFWYYCSLFSVKQYCDFEGGMLCGWYLSDPATPVPPHAFRWQTGQGESIHHGEENHRPANDHTLWAKTVHHHLLECVCDFIYKCMVRFACMSCVFCFVFTHLYTCTVCSGSSQGWYIFADSSNGGYGHTTDLLTAPIKITGPQCTLVFWYHMSGFTVGTLQVQLSRNYEYNCYSFAALVTQALKTSKHIVNVTVNFMLHFV